MNGLGGVPVVFALLVACIGAAALIEPFVARRDRARLVAVRDDDGLRRAEDRLVVSRARFSAVVRIYEATASRTSVLMGGGLGEDPARVTELEQEKEVARRELFDAQRELEALRLGDGPDARAGVWYGSGSMLGWQLGPIGFERFFLRLDHGADARCWSLWEVARPRFGFGLGIERQRIAIFTVRADADQLDYMIGLGLGGGEVAVRPGFAPVRTWRRLKKKATARAANHALLERDRVSDLERPPDAVTRTAVAEAIADELGQPLTAETRLPPGPSLLSISADGPSFLLAAWYGSTPNPILLSSSGHGVWNPQEAT